MRILNLTQHPATEDQRLQGVEDLDGEVLEQVKDLLTFTEIPSKTEIHERALELADLAIECEVDAAMIGGAPFFMGALEVALRHEGVKPVYAFSQRESIEEVQADGSAVKKAVFKHLGFVEV